MLQDSTNSWKAFSASCWLWKHFPCKKLSRCLKEVVAGWWEVGWIWQMRQNFVAQYGQLLKCWWCVLWSGVAMEKNWALSVDQRWLQVLQFSVHLINLLSMLLILRFRQDSESCRSFGQQTTSDHDLFLVQVGLWNVLWNFFLVQLLSWSTLVVV